MAVLSVPPWFPQASLYLIFAGLSSHAILAKGEWDLVAWKYMLGLAMLQPLSFGVICKLGQTLANSALLVLLLDLSFFLPLILSLSIYRLFFHPLYNFPGPFRARLSMYWKMHALTKQAAYQVTQELHQEYGDLVRTGPRMLSINRASALPVIYGAGTKCTKPALYSVAGAPSVNADRNPKSHSARRPAWDKALSSRSMLLSVPSPVLLLTEMSRVRRIRPWS